MKKKTLLSFLILLFCVFPHLSFGADSSNISIYSPAVILMESSTGKILYEKNSTEKMYPASLTKMMTAILILENHDLQETAIVSYEAVASIPVRI